MTALKGPKFSSASLNRILDLRGKILRSLNPNKVHGWDDISVRKIKICDDSLVFPLKLMSKTVCDEVFSPWYGKEPMLFQFTKRTAKTISRIFYPNCLKEWNDLAPEVRELPTVSSFKGKLFSLIRPPHNPTYGIYDPECLAISPSSVSVS